MIWFSFIAVGVLLGGVMFSKIIPSAVMKKNICSLGNDGNPGAANVFMNCGKGLGSVCLLLDILKGFLPVFVATFVLDEKNMLFSLVILAPALGHALGIFNRFHGGKCIATSFGIVLGLMPVTRIGFVLALFYIVFSVIIKIRSHRIRSIISFSLFAAVASVILCIKKDYSIALGCTLFSVVAIVKHFCVFNKIENIESGEKYCEKV